MGEKSDLFCGANTKLRKHKEKNCERENFHDINESYF
jgi:hypothetical protein